MTSRSGSFTASCRWLVPALGLALAVIAGVGCSSKPKPTPEQITQADVAQYEAQIRKVIPDSARADKLVGLTNEIQKLVHETVASAKDHRAKVAALNSNYEATRADYETLFNQQDTARDASLDKAIALRQRATSLTTDAEWEQLKKARLRMLDADLQELMSSDLQDLLS